MSRFSSLLCSLLFCMITYAQEITVTGKVTAGGEEMPGVTVAVKRTNSRYHHFYRWQLPDSG